MGWVLLCVCKLVSGSVSGFCKLPAVWPHSLSPSQFPAAHLWARVYWEFQRALVSVKQCPECTLGKPHRLCDTYSFFISNLKQSAFFHYGFFLLRILERKVEVRGASKIIWISRSLFSTFLSFLFFFSWTFCIQATKKTFQR